MIQKPLGLVLIVIAAAIVSGYAGYWYGARTAKSPTLAPDIGTTLPKTNVSNDSIITSQEAVAVGKIVKIDTNSITMQGKDGKISGFRLAAKYNIYPLPASGSAVPKPIQNIQELKLNENYLVHLVLQDNVYAATTIQALPNNI